MAKKNVIVLIKSNPFSWKVFEALRLAVGISMEHKTKVIFMKDGVHSLTDWKPQLIGIEPFDKSIEALGMMEAEIIAEEEALRERGLMLKKWPVEIKKLPKDSIAELIKEAEVVLTW
ncbi:MAG: sulfur reduction protein DsrE [Aquificota bacterium]|nr:MAG: sulfur reduction protein DsrE [Aquificota bacterium]